MPLHVVEDRLHVRVTCDSCRSATAELCGRGELEVTATRQAVPRFIKAGWHFDPRRYGDPRQQERAEREGAGRWYCPKCASQTHL